MRHILAMAILGASLAMTASAALAYSDNNNSGIPQRSWDGVQAQPAQIQLVSGGALSTVAGMDDESNPYRPDPNRRGLNK